MGMAAVVFCVLSLICAAVWADGVLAKEKALASKESASGAFFVIPEDCEELTIEDANYFATKLSTINTIDIHNPHQAKFICRIGAKKITSKE